jgi:ferredoxin
MTAGAKATVDPRVCALIGYCQEIAPEVFEVPQEGPGAANELRRQGYSRVKVNELTDPAQIAAAREAAASCPTSAISIEEDA